MWQAYDNEKRLVKKVRELNNEIVTNAAKVATALKLSEDDDATIDSLKKQIEKAWTMVEAYHEKEVRANETIQRLKGEIANLTGILEKQTGITGRDNTLDELLKVREVLTRRNEDAAATIQRMQADGDELVAKIEHKRQKNRDKKGVILELREQMKARDMEMERDGKKRERVDRELKVRSPIPVATSCVVLCRRHVRVPRAMVLHDGVPVLCRWRRQDLKAQLDQRVKASSNLAQAVKDSEVPCCCCGRCCYDCRCRCCVAVAAASPLAVVVLSEYPCSVGVS